MRGGAPRARSSRCSCSTNSCMPAVSSRGYSFVRIQGSARQHYAGASEPWLPFRASSSPREEAAGMQAHAHQQSIDEHWSE